MLKNVRSAGPDNFRRTDGSGLTASAGNSIYGHCSTHIDCGLLTGDCGFSDRRLRIVDFGDCGLWIVDFGDCGFWRLWILAIVDFGYCGFWLLRIGIGDCGVQTRLPTV